MRNSLEESIHYFFSAMAPQLVTWTFALLLAVHLIDFAKSDHEQISPQKVLLNDLLDRYGQASIPPVINQSDPVIIDLKVRFQLIRSFNESEQQLQVITGMVMSWRDEYMKWDPAEHDGVEFLFVPEDKIWTFDLTLYSSVRATAVEMDHDRLIVRPDGTVTWFSSAILHSFCLVHVRYFPFDKQYCKLVLASWAYDSTVVLINETGGDVTGKHFITNGVWDLHSIEKVDRLVKSPCCANPWSEVHYLIIFKRQAAYYVITLIIPGIALSLVSLLVFFMPPDSGQKVALASSNLLAMLLFQELVSTSMPPIGTQFPLIGTFFVSSIVISTWSIFSSLLIMYLHNKDNKPVPTWLRKLTMLKTGPNQPQPVGASPNWVERRFSSLTSAGTISQAVKVRSCRGKGQNTLGSNVSGSKYLEAPGNKTKKQEAREGTDDRNDSEGNGCSLMRDQMNAQWQEVALKVNRMMAFLLTTSIMLTALVITFLYIAQEEGEFPERT